MTNHQPTTRRGLLTTVALAGIAGAVTAAEMSDAPPAHAESQTITSGTGEVGLTILADGQGASFQQSEQAPTGTHALSLICHGRTDNNSAANVVSDNPQSSALMVTGQELGRGTIKVTHTGAADGSDANASALSLNLATPGTAAQGIFLDAAGTTGDLLQLRNSGARKLVVLSDGRIQFASPTSIAPSSALPATPDGYLRVLTPDGATVRIPYYAE